MTESEKHCIKEQIFDQYMADPGPFTYLYVFVWINFNKYISLY